MLTVNVPKFYSISLERTLNYTPYSQRLEKLLLQYQDMQLNVLMKR